MGERQKTFWLLQLFSNTKMCQHIWEYSSWAPPWCDESISRFWGALIPIICVLRREEKALQGEAHGKALVELGVKQLWATEGQGVLAVAGAGREVWRGSPLSISRGCWPWNILILNFCPLGWSEKDFCCCSHKKPDLRIGTAVWTVTTHAKQVPHALFYSLHYVIVSIPLPILQVSRWTDDAMGIKLSTAFYSF